MKAKNYQKLNFNEILRFTINTSDNQDLTTQLTKLNDLYKSGALTKEEFEKAKKKILN